MSLSVIHVKAVLFPVISGISYYLGSTPLVVSLVPLAILVHNADMQQTASRDSIP